MNGEGGEQGEMESLSAREGEVSLNFSIKTKPGEKKTPTVFQYVQPGEKFKCILFFAIVSDTSSDQFIILDSSGASACD